MKNREETEIVRDREGFIRKVVVHRLVEGR